MKLFTKSNDPDTTLGVAERLANVIFCWFLNIGSYVSGSPVQPDSAIRMIKAGALYPPFFSAL